MVLRSEASETPERVRTSWIGKLIAQRYRLIGRLGEGSMAEVYLARHVLIDRLSAIKILRPGLLSAPSSEGREKAAETALRRRFLQEAKAVNRINHPNIVEITDYGETENTAYLVMEYVPGEPLARHLADGPLGFERSLQLGLQVASALSRAHEMGVIHRDLTPANVLVVPRRSGPDLVKLTDFGVAKMLHNTSLGTGLLYTGPSATSFNPGYLAPEVTTLGSVDPRNDLYSLGVMLFQSTTGSLPFSPPTEASLRTSMIPAPRISDLVSGVPRLFDEVVATLLAIDPDDRPRDAFETFEMLRRVAEETDAPVSRTSMASLSRPSDPKANKSRPHLLTVTFERIGPMCTEAWASLLRALGLSAHDTIANAQSLDGELRSVLDGAERLVRMVDGLSRIVESDARAVAAAEERGRLFRSDYGVRIDALGKERSRSLGWAGTIAERHDYLKTQRNSGAHPISTADAMLWEQAALEREEVRAYAEAENHGLRLETLSRELEHANESLDHQLEVLGAQLEGHIAALRSLAAEAWAALDQGARALGVELPDATQDERSTTTGSNSL